MKAGLPIVLVIWLAAQVVPAQVPGNVIDHIPASAQQYIGSPSLAVWTDGSYLASHDIFGPGSSKDMTVVFRSSDRGRSWAKVATLRGQWWSTLFSHGRALYLIGTSRENGFTIIRRSTDGETTWSYPAGPETGVLLSDGSYHCAPVPVITHQGRLWRAMEDTSGPDGWGSYFKAFMMSAPEHADLLNASNWTFTNRIGRDPAWLDGRFGGWLEGNSVVAPGGGVVNLLRVDVPSPPEKAAILTVRGGGKELAFDPANGFVDFPGGAKKFTVRRDPRGAWYWSLTNVILPAFSSLQPGRVRNTLALTRSRDLRSWEIRSFLLSHPDAEKHAFQYVDWLFEGNDIIAVSRTAYDDGQGGAHNQHDANYMTFHRFRNFRKLAVKDPGRVAGRPH